MIDLRSLIQIGAYLVGIGIIYGTIRSKLSDLDEEIGKINNEIKDIKTQLGNHIQHISNDIRSICERIARIEGKFNGKQ